jgi:hypothetical protein
MCLRARLYLVILEATRSTALEGCDGELSTSKHCGSVAWIPIFFRPFVDFHLLTMSKRNQESSQRFCLHPCMEEGKFSKLTVIFFSIYVSSPSVGVRCNTPLRAFAHVTLNPPLHSTTSHFPQWSSYHRNRQHRQVSLLKPQPMRFLTASDAPANMYYPASQKCSTVITTEDPIIATVLKLLLDILLAEHILRISLERTAYRDPHCDVDTTALPSRVPACVLSAACWANTSD